mgnify:CR=1 FL=1
MSLIRYNPTVSPLRRGNVDSIFDDFMDIFDVFDPMTRRSSIVGPRTNVEDLDGKHVITMATPGISRDDIKVDVDNNTLTVSFDSENSENSNFNFQSSFKKSWTLGDGVNLECIAADYNNGVLSIEVPKAEKVVPTARRIDIN